MRVFRVLLFVWVLGAVPAFGGRTLRFSGYEWEVRGRGLHGPGPNLWSPRNAWVDERGRLHLAVTFRGGRWECAEVNTVERLGFGTYVFDVEGRVDALDRNVVLGLFSYPTADVGRDGTNEIDIEFAQWGRRRNPHGNFTVWPVEIDRGYTTKPFDFHLRGIRSRHSWKWTPEAIAFRSREGGRRLGKWTFAGGPETIAQQPMRVHIDLWLRQGQPPADGEEVEIVIRAFRFYPLRR